MQKNVDVNGCFYAKEEASIQEDIKVLEELKNKKYIVDKVEGWEQYLLTTRQQIAIENLIADNKRLDKENQALFEAYNFNDTNLLAKILKEYRKEILNSIPKSKVEELREIDNIDLLQFKIKELLQEGDKQL